MPNGFPIGKSGLMLLGMLTRGGKGAYTDAFRESFWKEGGIRISMPREWGRLRGMPMAMLIGKGDGCP